MVRRSSTPSCKRPLGRGPPGRGHRRPGHPGRPVGHREGVAAQLPAAHAHFTERPEIRVRVGDPVPLSDRSPDADTKRIMAALSTCCRPRPGSRSTPTAEELAATYPARLPGRPARRGRPPPGHRHLTQPTERRRRWPTRPRARPASAKQRFERRMTDAEALMWNVEKDPVAQPERGALIDPRPAARLRPLPRPAGRRRRRRCRA